MKKSEIAHVESQLKSIRDTLAKVSDAKAHDAFLALIHKPGFTTVAEGLFITAIVDAMQVQTRSLGEMQSALLSAASRVELNPQPLPP